MEPDEEDKVEKQLAEYERAQDVAQHDDAVIYEMAAIVWGAETLLLGFILEVKIDSANRGLIIASAAVGILMNICLPLVHGLVKKGQHIAFTICREIENELPLPHRLHNRIHNAYHPKRTWTWAVRILSTVFICVWFYVIGYAATYSSNTEPTAISFNKKLECSNEKNLDENIRYQEIKRVSSDLGGDFLVQRVFFSPKLDSCVLVDSVSVVQSENQIVSTTIDVAITDLQAGRILWTKRYSGFEQFDRDKERDIDSAIAMRGLESR